MTKLLPLHLILELEPIIQTNKEKFEEKKEEITEHWILDNWSLQTIAHYYNIEYTALLFQLKKNKLTKKNLLKKKGDIFQNRVLKNKPPKIFLTKILLEKLKSNKYLIFRRCENCKEWFLIPVKKINKSFHCDNCKQ